VGDLYKKIIKITMLILSASLIFIFSLEKINIYVASIFAGIISKSPEVESIVTTSYKDAWNWFIPTHIIDYIFLIITLIAIPLCLKYKSSIVSKITIVVIPVICLIDIASYFITGSFCVYGFISIFILVYAVIISVFVFKDIKTTDI
jgi:hypothetical protein